MIVNCMGFHLRGYHSGPTLTAAQFLGYVVALQSSMKGRDELLLAVLAFGEMQDRKH